MKSADDVLKEWWGDDLSECHACCSFHCGKEELVDLINKVRKEARLEADASLEVACKKARHEALEGIEKIISNEFFADPNAPEYRGANIALSKLKLKIRALLKGEVK